MDSWVLSLKNNSSQSTKLVRSPNRIRKLEVKGKLIVVEGIDGSGKSTQIRLLGKWLISKRLPVFMTEWNSSEMVKEITSKGKKKGRLTSPTFSLLHATDFADRYERNIFPLLRGGYIVLIGMYILLMLEILLEGVVQSGFVKFMILQ